MACDDYMRGRAHGIEELKLYVVSRPRSCEQQYRTVAFWLEALSTSSHVIPARIGESEGQQVGNPSVWKGRC